jgi:hypothetical protein
MIIDISLLKNIDFTNRDTLLFLAISFCIALAGFFIVIAIVVKIIRVIKRAIARMFRVNKKPKLNSTEWLETQLQKVKVPENLPKLENTPKQSIVHSNPVTIPNYVASKPQEVKELERQILGGPVKSEPIKEGLGEQIKIPTRTHYPIGSGKLAEVAIGSTGSKPEYAPPSQKLKENRNTDSSIFHGESEVSRLKLEHELRTDTIAAKAAKQIGLNMSPIERSKLVKEVFSRSLGRNISKNDVRLGVKKLNRKMLGAKSSQEHAKIRKEIKFFKKIGGIK